MKNPHDPHQVLARKWRPRSFEEVVGQAPIVRALTNSLTQNRLHHAYLFTGTRGVGKTSIARLFAKCLNCQQGVSSTPCGTCQNCHAIDEGRFLDLLEVDAASRTKVEDTRDLLDNVQYAPTQGRYKIYLIDEVHMLSNHSFNALLKTLEEPPPHVKFLLATTDPQRLPVTVLSRCLQFHLKNLSAEHIAKQLAHILTAENISHESTALTNLAYAAQGSMRDALSLMDQAIAYTNGQLTAKDVKTLLGATEPTLLLALLSHLVDGNAKQMLSDIHTLAESGVDFPHILEELLSLLHQITLEQIIPGIIKETHPDAEKIAELAQTVTAEVVQLYYQIGLIGRRDLPLAPAPRIGFEMVLLRMLAFRPQSISIDTFLKRKTQQSAAPPLPEKNGIKKGTTPVTNLTQSTVSSPLKKKFNTPFSPEKKSFLTPSTENLATDQENTQAVTDENNWATLLSQLNLQGAASLVAIHCTLKEQSPECIELALDPNYTALLNKSIETDIANALKAYFHKSTQLIITTSKSDQKTPALLDKKRQEERKCQAADALSADENLQMLVEQFDGKIITNSIQLKKSE